MVTQDTKKASGENSTTTAKGLCARRADMPTWNFVLLKNINNELKLCTSKTTDSKA